MTILFLDQYSDLGGGQLCLLDLLPALRRAGFAVHAAIPGDGAFAARLAAAGAVVHPLCLPALSTGRKTPADALRFAARLPAVTREIRLLAGRLCPALIYVNGPRLMPAVAAARLNVPVLFHAHNRLHAAQRVLVRVAVARCRATVVAASRFVWPHADRVVYSGVAGPQAPRHNPAPHPRIGLIGRIAPQKGQLPFVRAARRLPEEWRFVLCGATQFADPRYLDVLRREAPASVTFLGWRDDVYGVLASLDLLVVPSAGEGGVPRVILEAFAVEVPVLALDSGAIPEVVRDGVNGFLLSSTQDLTRRLKELLSERDLLGQVARRARRDYETRFTADRYRQELWALVEDLSNTRQAAAAASPTPAAPRTGPL